MTTSAFKQESRPVKELPGQFLSPTIWQASSVSIPTRLQPQAPKELAELKADVEAAQAKLEDIVDEYARTEGTDPHADEKKELESFLALYAERVQKAHVRLNFLRQAPSPAVRFKDAVASAEFEVSSIARELENRLMTDVAVSQYDSELRHLDLDTRKQIRNRTSIRKLCPITGPIFHAFSRLPGDHRPIEAPNNAVKRIREALSLLASTIKKALSN